MKKHLLRRLFALLLCLALLCALCAPVFADFGDFGGDNDYGGGDDGGGWGWDDDSWDSDTRSLDGGSIPISFKTIVIVAVIFIVLRIVLKILTRGTQTQSRSAAGPSVGADLPPLRPIEAYSGLDPNFSASKLQQKLSNLYIQMQQCWQAKDIESLRPYFTDAYFSQLDRQLDAYRKNGITNYIERPVVLSVRFEGYRQTDGADHVYAVLKTRLVDYKLKDESGELVSGSRTKEKFMTYRWHLTRPSGQISDTEEGLRTFNCPNCGAPLSINESAKCPYCDSVVTVEPHDFVIADIEGLAQQTA